MDSTTESRVKHLANACPHGLLEWLLALTVVITVIGPQFGTMAGRSDRRGIFCQ